MGNWGHIAVLSFLVHLISMVCPNHKKVFYFTNNIAQEKIAQNTNNLLNLFHLHTQAEYYLIGPNIILIALYCISLLFPHFES